MYTVIKKMFSHYIVPPSDNILGPLYPCIFTHDASIRSQVEIAASFMT